MRELLIVVRIEHVAVRCASRRLGGQGGGEGMGWGGGDGWRKPCGEDPGEQKSIGIQGMARWPMTG